MKIVFKKSKIIVTNNLRHFIIITLGEFEEKKIGKISNKSLTYKGITPLSIKNLEDIGFVGLLSYMLLNFLIFIRRGTLDSHLNT